MARALLLFAACLIPLPLAAAEPIDFDRQIAPLLARRCLDCHSGEEPEGGLRLRDRKGALRGGDSGAALVPGKPDESLLWQRVADGEMPPKKSLADDERALLKDWIAAGARWGTDPIDPFRFTTDVRAGYDWWSLQPVKRPVPPAPEGNNPIDAFVRHRLREAGLSPSPPVERRLLIRRLSQGLIGLPPTPEEVEAFVADTRPDAYERLVDRLLASPHYGERWARHWLDLARFGESQGFERDKLRSNSWPYRDWVIAALNRDLPYDDFIRLQVAGDVLRPHDADAIAATGFLTAGAYDEVGKTQQSAAGRAVVRQDELEDLVSVVSQTFLGLTANCARCHDHKFDPIRQEEYYRLAAALAGVEHGSRALPREALEEHVGQQVAALKNRQKLLERRLAARERPVRERILAERRSRTKESPPPVPLAEWTFDTDARDTRGTLHGELHGSARIAEGRLLLDGKDAYLTTAPFATDLTEKTLVAWIELDNLTQRGGAALGVQTLDGNQFDAIVFGEKEPRRWMAGSDYFRRTSSFAGEEEKEADRHTVIIALVYQADGTIAGYRDGLPYGRAYKAAEVVKYEAKKAQVTIGIRHTPAASGRLLAGAIDRAMLFDRALDAAEVARLAGVETTHIPEAELVSQLSEEDRAARSQVQFELAHLDGQIARYQEYSVYAVAPQAPHPVHVLARGEPGQRRDEVAPGGIAALVGLPAEFGLPKNASDAERRQKLADWLASERNPLTVRVIVNRLWHYHFGTGLVDTPNDFGFSGGRPSHPELLDWLAAELIDSGWSLKHVQRLIVTSATYQQQSLPTEEGLARDADNRLLWRMSPQRLDAESLRDAMLAISGQWNREFGGPGYADFRTFTDNSQFYEPVDVAGASFHRRSVYRTWVRSGRSPFLDVFDCPDPSTKTPARSATTTPLQALSLLNNAFVLRMSDATAARIAAQTDDPARQVEALYRLVYLREPSSAERQKAADCVERHGLPALVRVIFNSNEFLYVD